MICFFCFYNISSGIQSNLAFSDSFKHCNIITFDGEIWILTEFDLQGIHQRKVQAESAVSLMRGMKHISCLTALVVVNVFEKTAIPWKPCWVRSCNELDRYISGVDIGFTFNPKHLYNKLIKYHRTNYEILYEWRR